MGSSLESGAPGETRTPDLLVRSQPLYPPELRARVTVYYTDWMGRHSSSREIEIKLPVADAAAGERLLRGAGFRVSVPRVFEANTVFDTAEGRLRAANTLLRVREVDGEGLLTFKGPPAPGRHKSREELEVRFAGPGLMIAILGRLGFHPAFRYEKYRTEYTDGAGTATLDETPIGVYLELEGEPEWIDGAAAALGFAEADYLTGSYLQLYREHCERLGLPPADMVFQPKPPASV
jgi:adenylate cyclase, class 2